MSKVIVFALCITAFFNATAIPNLVQTPSLPDRKTAVVVETAMFKVRLKVTDDITVKAIKKCIERKKGIAVCEQLLYMRARGNVVILKDKQKLSSLGLSGGATLKLFRKRSQKTA